MTRWSAHLFAARAEAGSLSAEQVAEALAFSKELASKGVFPLLTLNHLAHQSGVSYGLLRGIVERDERVLLIRGRRGRGYYRSFRITKRSGGVRRILVAGGELQRALTWLNTYVLTPLQPHSRCFSFRTGRSVVDCAREHCSSRWLVKFDVRNFFESIGEYSVYRVFKDVGFPSLLSFELARLVTVPMTYLLSNGRSLVGKEPSNEHTIGRYACGESGVLGQGLPTSPMLSNLVAAPLDRTLDEVAEKMGFVFTRYADDLTFSTRNKVLTSSTIGDLRRHVRHALRANGLEENAKKFSVAGPGARKIVLGLLVDGDRPRLSKASRSRIEGHLKHLSRTTLSEHAMRRGFRSIDGLREHVLGLLAYVKQVDEVRHEYYRQQWETIDWPSS